MKRLLSVFLFLFCCVIAADAQDDAVQYDSIMNLMKNKKIPLMERYYMTGDIEYLSREHQIAVLKQLIPEAKEVEDKAVITRLYSYVPVPSGSYPNNRFRQCSASYRKYCCFQTFPYS